MKVISFLIFSFFFITVKSQTSNSIADNILQKVSNKLNSFQNIRYDLKREVNYSSENYHNETTWTEYF